jgi:hypothetical protein
MPNDESSQVEKRRVLANDQSVREQRQAATYHAFGQIDADEPSGRFHQMSGATHVVGSTLTPEYPRAAPPFREDFTGTEPPLGVAIDEMQPLDPLAGGDSLTGDTGPVSADAPSSPFGDVQRADAGPSSPAGKEDGDG